MSALEAGGISALETFSSDNDSGLSRRDEIAGILPVAFVSRRATAPFATTFVSNGVRGLTGFSPNAFMGESNFLTSRIHPEDVDRVARVISAAATAGAYRCEYRWLCADGKYRSLLEQGEPADEDELAGVILDVSEQRLHDDQLAQDRKMDAVGRLTGGVAHDFNNLLTVVLGNIDMLSRRPEDARARTRRIDAIRLAAERGRDLMRQLLVFSRRQHLSPVTLDLAAHVRGLADLLERNLGEGVSLKLDLKPVHANVDPVQLEAALTNLATNARDAMPEGGRLTVSTRSQAGRAVIELTDTGAGMTDEVRERAFEPFFTTKAVGKGSGLGLSQVYGFVRQSGGQVEIESEPGEGATVRLSLPPAAAVKAAPAKTTGTAAEGGGERLLVVEDDPAVLELARDMLSDLGYQVTTATDARQALEVLRGDRPVDLLFSDVIMPGKLNGVGLAREAHALRPDMQILLTSGYVGERAGLGANEYPLIDKPYEAMALATTIRSMLDQGAQGAHH